MLSAAIEGDVAGVHFSTPEPLRLRGEGRCFGEGPLDLATEDLTPVLSPLGITVPIMSLKATATLSCKRSEPLVAMSGDLGASHFEASLRSKALNDWAGDIRLGSLSLPGLIDALILHPEGGAGSGQWPSARFSDHKSINGRGQFALSIGQLDLGNGFAAQDASMSLGITPDGVILDGASGRLSEGKIGGKLELSRQGGLGAITGEIRLETVAINGLASSPRLTGSLSGNASFGSSGQSIAGMISNLGGAGELRLDDLAIADTDPTALHRLSSHLLQDAAPLREGFIPASLRKELAQAKLQTAPISTPVSIVGGVMRLSQVTLDGGASSWRGMATFDLKTSQLGARGILQSKSGPEGWQGAPPQVGLSWSGPLATLTTMLDPAPLANGIAAIILKRETDRIQQMEAEARQRKMRAEQQDKPDQGQPSPGTVPRQP